MGVAGAAELRVVSRHPRYKTEICKTFHTIGTCPYGRRCRFIHNETTLSPTSAAAATASVVPAGAGPRYHLGAAELGSDVRVRGGAYCGVPQTPPGLPCRMDGPERGD
jgi:butyrate response factor